jgi:hypothetical protein
LNFLSRWVLQTPSTVQDLRFLDSCSPIRITLPLNRTSEVSPNTVHGEYSNTLYASYSHPLLSRELTNPRSPPRHHSTSPTDHRLSDTGPPSPVPDSALSQSVQSQETALPLNLKLPDPFDQRRVRSLFASMPCLI